MAQQLAATDYKALRSATRRLIDLAGGGSSAQYITRVQPGQLSEYGAANPNPNRPVQFIPIDVVLDLESDTDSPTVTREMARLQGYELVRMPDRAAAAGICDPMKAHGEHTVLIGRAAEVAIAMDADKRRTVNELTDYEAALVKARDKLDEMLEQVRAETVRRRSENDAARLRAVNTE